MNTQNTNLPEPATLANLAAQPRFAGLPENEAILAALSFFKRCAAAIDMQVIHDDIEQRGAELPAPEQWPAPLAEFYRLIVKGKDSADNQPRFRAFLLHQWREYSRPPSIKLGPEDVERKADKEFEAIKESGFSIQQWREHAWAYTEWWTAQKHAAKQRAGLAGARKRKGKLTEQQSPGVVSQREAAKEKRRRPS